MRSLSCQRISQGRRYGARGVFSWFLGILLVGHLVFCSSYVRAKGYPAVFQESADSPFGIVFNQVEEPRLEDKAFHVLRELGVKWVRVRIPWANLEPKKGHYREKYFQELDGFIGRLGDERINAIGWLSSGRVPVWALQGDFGGKKSLGQKATKHIPPNPGDLKDFLGVVIKRYKTRIRNWIILNEVSGPKNKNTPERLVEIMRSVYPAAKNVDPGCTIIMAGIGYGNFQEYYDKFFSLGGGEYIDVVDRHMYFHLSRIPIEIPLTRRLMAKYNLNKPVQIGEFSNPSHYRKPTQLPPRARGPWAYPEGTPDAQAQLLVKRMVLALSEGVVKMIQSNIRDKAPSLEASQRAGRRRGTAAWKLESGYFWSKGITDYDYNPKPAFHAYKTLIRKLDRTEFDKELYFHEDLRIFVFRKDEKCMAVFWAWGRDEQNREVTLRVKGQEMVISDKFGKVVKRVAPSGGHMTLTVTPDPMYLQWASEIAGGKIPPPYEERYKMPTERGRKKRGRSK